MKKIKKIILSVLAIGLIFAGGFAGYKYYKTKHYHKPKTEKHERKKVGDFYVEIHKTQKYSKGRTNRVEAVVLHHTAEVKNIRESLLSLCYSDREASCHVLIDFDGTRYELATPDKVTWHAGYSYLNGKDNVNYFSVGIEFQGNTCKTPLTESQINSAIDYLLPIIKRYNIPLRNIVTHEQIRHDWIVHNPKKVKELKSAFKPVLEKPDITKTEHERFMKELKIRMSKQL